MIPRILHQTAKTVVLSDRWKPLQRMAQEFHPGWEYRLWTDEDNLALIRDRRPDLEAAYSGLPRPVMRADLIRYVYMEQFGGLYFDTDYQFLRVFDLLDRDLVLPAESDPGFPVFLGNCIFASVPGHPFWTAVLDELKGTPPTAENTRSENDIIQRTGPGFLTRIWKSRFESDPTVFVPPRAWFHPPVPRDDGALASVTSNSATYGIHWCFGSWRALTPWSRLKNRVKGLFR